ncbi:alanine:cation symporter family protein, partial [Anaerotignum sp.]|uniref:alanine:cation symporter family protein n=1 Tax=Anaerotignum sp. TaxID=2039241 RepID=UPI0028A2793B
IARGLFTNESGLGSAPIAAAAARTKNPVRQALIAMSAVFWDTIIVCALTGLVLVSSILKSPEGMVDLDGGALTSAAFNHIPVIGPIVLTIGLVTFAWSTILGWSYYGERAWVYLVGTKCIKPFRVVWVIVSFVGCVMSLKLVWNIADTLNAMMAFPNLIALLGLSGVIVSETKKYLWSENLDDWSTDEIPSLDR